MTYTMRVTFVCDGCGLAVEQSSLLAPNGWLEPGSPIRPNEGPHLCPICVDQRRQKVTVLPPQVRLQ